MQPAVPQVELLVGPGHNAVQNWPHFFLEDGTPDDEIDAHRRHEYAAELAKVGESAKQTNPEREVRVLKPEPLRDEDAVVAIPEAGARSREAITI